jgi:hypothetical protein
MNENGPSNPDAAANNLLNFGFAYAGKTEVEQ